VRSAKLEEVAASAEEGRRLNEKVLKMMAGNCGQDESYFIDQIHDRKHADWFLTAEEAHQVGIVNHMRMPKMQVDMNVKWSFK
jgi:ATP-dependent Clp protease, protease subunit